MPRLRRRLGERHLNLIPTWILLDPLPGLKDAAIDFESCLLLVARALVTAVRKRSIAFINEGKIQVRQCRGLISP